MHDLKWIRENPEAFDRALVSRGLEPASAAILALDAKRRAAQTTFQELQSRRNELSRQVGEAKRKGGDTDALTAEVSQLKDVIAAREAEEKVHATALDAMLAVLPNLPVSEVPVGPDETHNLEIRRVGNLPEFAFKPREHWELGERLGLMDFEAAAKIGGARFVVLRGPLARLERALAQFMLDLHTGEFGYTEISPPMLVRDHALYGTGNLPKFGEDLFKVENADLRLIPTAEVPLTNLAADAIIDEVLLPLRFTAWTGCFRAEAGAAGKDTRGMLRQHQFYKVELVSIAHPERSEEEHERMTACAEEALKRLGLPYRTVVLCTGDMGFASRKTYDIEVWLPGQGRYREISSCSNCGDFQARRMKARFRRAGEKGTQLVHTLNGSGVAVGRALIAVMENFQQADGSIAIPGVLRPYMGGVERIARDV
ncbi:MAG TPA: serine--tRNA ligase [Alphaproteobacteria bacterium]|nr:serine--tRNA ligase [Alphaproteobacteria bacterium]